jgi:RNA recognition motif-containing protein
MMTNIYVGNLSYQLTDDDLRTAFADFGQVTSAKIITDRDTGQSKGFGFVEMPVAADAKTAIEKLDGTELKGRKLRVNEARPKPDTRSARPPRRS